jgi:hypothetical protein
VVASSNAEAVKTWLPAQFSPATDEMLTSRSSHRGPDPAKQRRNIL